MVEAGMWHGDLWSTIGGRENDMGYSQWSFELHLLNGTPHQLHVLGCELPSLEGLHTATGWIACQGTTVRRIMRAFYVAPAYLQ